MKNKILLSLILLNLTAFATEPSSAIEKLKLQELAKTYPKEKIEKSLKGYKNIKTESSEALSHKAVLVDLNITSVEMLNKKNYSTITEYVSDFLDNNENSLGNISDKNIFEKVLVKWNDTVPAKDNLLLEKLNVALANGLMTGYNLKNINSYANFDKTLSVSYGHNDITHAIQLIALLKSEGIDTKVQLEPKTSAFLHNPNWGTPNYDHIILEDGKIVVTPTEYDLKFQFANNNDKIKFTKLVDLYAKKDSKDQEGLIYKSWWQPFIQTDKIEGYQMLISHLVKNGDFEANVLTLPKNSKAFVDFMKKGSDLKVTTQEVWVNPAFYRFMEGDYK